MLRTQDADVMANRLILGVVGLRFADLIQNCAIPVSSKVP